MPTFAFKAHDKRANKEVTDSVDAPNQMEAIAAIKRLGYLPIEVKESKSRGAKAGGGQGASGGGKKGMGFSFGGVKPAVVTLFTRQLSTLQDAGLPIVQSLQILTNMQRPGTFKNALGRVTDDVQSGTMLSEAM